MHIKDALGRTWQCGTIQLDMALPERFDLSYIAKNNEKYRPLMIHRVIYGSIERFFGILIEHFAGKFPLWMTPVQVIILPINDDLIPYANKVQTTLVKAGFRTEVDSRTESLNKKVREAQVNKIPLILTIGKKEKESGALSVRTLDGKVRYGIAMEEFLKRILEHINERSLDLEIF
jgi:threonyl-tRNA synthetase